MNSEVSSAHSFEIVEIKSLTKRGEIRYICGGKYTGTVVPKSLFQQRREKLGTMGQFPHAVFFLSVPWSWSEEREGHAVGSRLGYPTFHCAWVVVDHLQYSIDSP